MEISKVLTYKNAWDIVLSRNKEELNDILESLPFLIFKLNEYYKSEKRISFLEIWEKLLTSKNWNILDRGTILDSGLRVNIGSIGPVKHGVSAIISLGSPDTLNRWLFHRSAIACKFNIVEIPILLVPIKDFAGKSTEYFYNRFTFELCQSLLEPLIPMNHGYPFLILGYSDLGGYLETEVIEIEADPMSKNSNVVIDRCIEFPPEYYHAGINILNFFGTYIKEQYPKEEATVKIEQLDGIVRLVIESKDGKVETIEKALDEYQLILSGQNSPEDIVKSEKLLLEMKNELRIAKYRIESQQDIIQVQNSRIDKLMDIVGTGLATKPSFSIDFHPNVSATCNLTINQNISSSIGNLSELKEALPKNDENILKINDLAGSLESIENEENPGIVKKSSAMSKFKRFVDALENEESSLNKTIKTIENGWEIAKELAGKYNSIAEWCGLPQVPRIFTK